MTRPWSTKIAKRFVFATVGVLAMALAVSWLVGSELVAPKPSVVGEPPPDLPATAIALPSESGDQVSGWHIRSESSRGVVILLHGLRATRLSMLDRARLFYQAGYSVVLVDLQAHGESPGENVTAGYLEKHDASAAATFVKAEHPDESIGVVGVSLGGASAVLASPLGIDALVLEAIYPDIRSAVHNRTAMRLGALGWLPAEVLLAQLQLRLGVAPSDLRPIDKVGVVGCSVLVIAGTDDQHTTVAEARTLFDAAKEPKTLWLQEGASHVDFYRAAPEEYEKRVLQFLDTHMR